MTIPRSSQQTDWQPDRAAGTTTTVKVWDRFVRVFHWGLVAGFATAYATGDEIAGLHVWAGYSAAALVAMRLVWGFVGTTYARFSQFVKSPAAVLRYLSAIATGREARYLGHNPAGGAMVLALLTMLAGLSVTGILMTTQAYAHADALEEVHEAIANLTLVLVVLHVGGVVLASVRHRESLVRAMITGRKRAPEPGDIA
jgi:cytochrome b